MSVEIGSKMAADNSYGMNGDQRPVSDTPNNPPTRASLTVNHDGQDSVLETIKQRGSSAPSLTAEQLRDISGSRPASFGMRPVDTPRVPGTMDWHADTAAKPKS